MPPVTTGTLDPDLLPLDGIMKDLRIHLRAIHPDAAASNPYVNATPQVITLPDKAKAQYPMAAGPVLGWARAGSGTLGSLTASASGTAPAASTVAVAPSGDLLVNAGDAWTSVDVSYTPERQDIVSANYAVTPGTGVVNGLPAGIVSVLEAESLAGGVVGKCIVVAPAASAPTTGQAGMTLGKTGVFCCIADAVTSVRLKLGVIPVANY